jgi:hypothetical protein
MHACRLSCTHLRTLCDVHGLCSSALWCHILCSSIFTAYIVRSAKVLLHKWKNSAITEYPEFVESKSGQQRVFYSGGQQCRSLKVHRRFRGAYCLHLQDHRVGVEWRWRQYVPPKRRRALKTTRYLIPEDSTLRSHRCENHKSIEIRAVSEGLKIKSDTCTSLNNSRRVPAFYKFNSIKLLK